MGWVVELVAGQRRGRCTNASLEDSPVRRAHVLKVFSNNSKVKVDSGSRLMGISTT